MSNKFQNPNLVVKNGVFLFLRFLLVLFLGFFTTRLTLQILGDEKFGIYNIVGGIIAIFAIISMPVRDSLQRFFNVELSQENRSTGTVFFTSVRIVRWMNIIITILYETVGLYLINYVIKYPAEETLAVNIIFQISVVSNLLGFVALPYISLLFSKENMSVPAICEIVGAVVKIILLYLIPFVSVDVLIPYACIFLLTNFAFYLFYYIYCRKKYPECFVNADADKELQKNMLGFSGWSFVEAVAGIAQTYVSNVFINIFGGVLYNTAYGISKQLQNAVVGFSSNVLKASDPQITSSTATDNNTYRDQLVMTTAKLSLLGVAFVYIVFHFDGGFLLGIWLDKVPQYALQFCDLALLATVFASITLPFRTLILATGKVRGYFMTYGIVSLISMVFMFVILKMGASMVSVMYILAISNLIMLLFAIFYAYHLASMNIPFVIKNSVLALVTVILAGGAYYLIRQWFNNEIMGMTVSMIVGFAVLALLGYFVAFNAKEKEKTKGLVQRLLKR